MRDTIVRLQSSWSYYRLDDGALELACLPRGKRLTLPGDAAYERALDALVEGLPEEELTASVTSSSGLSEDQVDHLLAELAENGALVTRARGKDLAALDGSSLYDRQIRFLSFYEDMERSGFDLNEKLQNRTVVIPGIGGLGGWIGLQCARLGIRKLIGIDPDRVELSNLHRQIMYTREDIGALKIDAAARRITEVDPAIEYVGHAKWIREPEDLLGILEGADLVINSFPYLPSFVQASRSVSQAALKARVPCLHLPIAQCIGPLTVPGATACIDCAWTRIRASFQTDYVLRANSPVGSRRGFLGALAPRQAIQGSLAAWETVRFLSGMDRPPTLNGIALVDISTFEHHEFMQLQRYLDCPMCGQIDEPAEGGRMVNTTASFDAGVWRKG